MKSIYLLIFSSILLVTSCTKKEEVNNTNQQVNTEGNKLLMLKVDYVSYAFEGGTEMSFDSNIENDTIPLTVDYAPPGDFGSIKLFHQPTDELVFHGTVIWMGTGERIFPEELLGSSAFTFGIESITNLTPSDIQIINPDPSSFGSGVTDTELDNIWASVSGLEATQYYESQGASIGIFKYTPSVGIGDPAEWDWYVMLYL